MPAKNPVIGVVVPTATYAAVKRLAALQSRGMSAVVRDFLVETTPVLERVAAMLELAYKAEGKWPAEMVHKLESLQTDMEREALAAMGNLDMFEADMEAHAKAAAGRRRRPPNPPMTNRGVTPPRKTPRTPSRKARNPARRTPK